MCYRSRKHEPNIRSHQASITIFKYKFGSKDPWSLTSQFAVDRYEESANDVCTVCLESRCMCSPRPKMSSKQQNQLFRLIIFSSTFISSQRTPSFDARALAHIHAWVTLGSTTALKGSHPEYLLRVVPKVDILGKRWYMDVCSVRG